jgi:uncharacterized membrane protein
VPELLLGHSLLAYRAGELAFARGWPLTWLYGLLLVALVAIVASLWRHRRLQWWRLATLALLQLAFCALLLVLLWRPVLRLEHQRERENVVAVLVDGSPSMQRGAQPRGAAAIAALQARALPQIARGAQLRYFSFTDHARPVDDPTAVPAGPPQTRIGTALREVLRTAGSVPLAAVVLVSDGAENGGSLGEDDLQQISALHIPVHTIGVGPLAPVNDLELAQLSINDSAAVGETLKAEVSIRHQQQRSARLRVYDGSKLLAAQEIALSADATVTTAGVEVPAGTAGLHDLRFELDALPDEDNVRNNGRSQVLDVAARRRSVLYIEGEPRWEYKFIRRALEGDPALRLASLVRATPNRYYRQGVESPTELVDGFPRDAAQLFAYDAVVIGSLEAAALNAGQHEALKDYVDRRGGSLLMLAGRDGLGDGGWSRVPVAQVLPALLTGTGAQPYARRTAKARLTVYGAESPLGQLATDPAKNATQWSGLPLLGDLQALGALRPGATVLLEAVAANLSYPLLVTQRYGRGASYLLATSSTWHWQMRLAHDDGRHALFWRQMLRTLAQAAPPQSSLRLERKVFDDESAVPVEAEIRDAQFRPVNDAEVSVKLLPENGAPAELRLLASGRGDGRYAATLSAADAGLYRLEMTARRGKEVVGEAVTHLRRNDGVLENFEDYQHKAMLERIAQLTGGRYWSPDDLGELPEAIRYSRAGMVERETFDLWNLPAALLLLLLLKGGEWLLRRRWGRL